MRKFPNSLPPWVLIMRERTCSCVFEYVHPDTHSVTICCHQQLWWWYLSGCDLGHYPQFTMGTDTHIQHSVQSAHQCVGCALTFRPSIYILSSLCCLSLFFLSAVFIFVIWVWAMHLINYPLITQWTKLFSFAQCSIASPNSLCRL